MKKIFVVTLLSFIIIGTAKAEVVVCEQVSDKSGTRVWNSAPEFQCWYPGTECKVSTYPLINQESVDIQNYLGGGWILTGYFSSIGLETVGRVPSETAQAQLTGFTFFASEEFYIRVVDSPNFPQLNGVCISLNNVSLGSNGLFTLYIPPCCN